MMWITLEFILGFQAKVLYNDDDEVCVRTLKDKRSGKGSNCWLVLFGAFESHKLEI